MEVKVKIEKTLHTDNDKVFYEDEDIAFEMGKTGDKYIGRIKKIKKKSIIIDNIQVDVKSTVYRIIQCQRISLRTPYIISDI